MDGKVFKDMARATLALLTAAALGAQAAPTAPDPDADLAVQAREAWAKRDRRRLTDLVDAARAQNHPLAGWVEYF
ncbi:hypothetical protein NL466_29260, partial [Klebsiella pneumoniae]|nr:hypothetical protein [Klebsiella pneumoniae]